MTSTTTTALESAATIPAGNGNLHGYAAPVYVSEKEGATSRFAAAQKLFKQQAAAQSNPQHLTSAGRRRTSDTTSLHTRLDRSVSNSSLPTSQKGTSLGLGDASFCSVFMKTNARRSPHPERAPALAASECPPTPVDQGCFLLGPRRTLQTLDVTTQISARTANDSPAWYCRHDKLVVFDGVSESNGTPKLITRSSRGLDMSRRNCPKASIRVDIPCTHCQTLLKRKSWVFEERMLECRVCKACQDRCWHEWSKQQQTATCPILRSLDETSPTTKDELKQDQVEPSAPAVSPIEVAYAKHDELPNKRDSVLEAEDPDALAIIEGENE